MEALLILPGLVITVAIAGCTWWIGHRVQKNQIVVALYQTWNSDFFRQQRSILSEFLHESKNNDRDLLNAPKQVQRSADRVAWFMADLHTLAANDLVSWHMTKLLFFRQISYFAAELEAITLCERSLKIAVTKGARPLLERLSATPTRRPIIDV